MCGSSGQGQFLHLVGSSLFFSNQEGRIGVNGKGWGDGECVVL